MTRRELIKFIGLNGIMLSLPTKLVNAKINNNEENDMGYEALIIGGSYAGLSAAMALGRSLRKVLIVDSGKPCNRFTPKSHNFITQDGVSPEKISLIAKEQVLQYETVEFETDTVKKVIKHDNVFEVILEKGRNIRAQKIVFATGVRDILPDIMGFAECWGKSIIHCPYCHGFEYKDMKTAIFTNHHKAMHLAPLIRNLTDNVTIITKTIEEYTEDDIKSIKRNKISIIESDISELEHNNGKLKNIILSSGKKLAIDVLYSPLPFKQSTTIPLDLGCNITESGLIEVDMFQKTNIDGVYACGDNSWPLRSVASAVHTGNIAGSILNMDLANESFTRS